MARKIFILLYLLAWCGSASGQVLVGTLQSTVENAPRAKAAGLQLAVLELSWDRFQPQSAMGVDSVYVAEQREKIRQFREAGLEVILEPGIQYAPSWIFDVPESRYRNQYGEVYRGSGPGKEIANSVFSDAVRIAQAAYMDRVFELLGDGFYAVRVGGGWYGELTYPEHRFAGSTNCYWAYDACAQGERPGLPLGQPPCPVPGWRPGQASEDHRSARLFLEWYHDALAHFLAWQVEIVRNHYQGRIMVLFPSWGIRPGQSEAAILADLSGSTSPEVNGELGRGVDFARQVRAIRDPRILLHCTWLDADPSFGSDPPIRYLATLARASEPPHGLSAENTGGGGQAALELCASRAREFPLTAFLWAFEPDLLDGREPEMEALPKAFRGGER